MWTYKQVYDKLTEAYIKGEVNAWNPCFCMVGNILNNKQTWAPCRNVIAGIVTGVGELVYDGIYHHSDNIVDQVKEAKEFIRTESEGTYTPQEIADIEAVFMMTYLKKGGKRNDAERVKDEAKEENALWLAFVAGLEKIKQVHISKGEDIDFKVSLKKRSLV